MIVASHRHADVAAVPASFADAIRVTPNVDFSYAGADDAYMSALRAFGDFRREIACARDPVRRAYEVLRYGRAASGQRA
ncbi:hypothetical protein AKJ09_07979 [Labilithrix luteola]|uniref:Uncharacterized protein n=1 Tax=Labilithrix luteola TaxID=1391654 RepID=A0A0K1Q662_9BACT|nr:hypothetical protein AKJ09_07979 [Labilithrix luteola]